MLSFWAIDVWLPKTLFGAVFNCQFSPGIFAGPVLGKIEFLAKFCVDWVYSLPTYELPVSFWQLPWRWGPYRPRDVLSGPTSTSVRYLQHFCAVLWIWLTLVTLHRKLTGRQTAYSIDAEFYEESDSVHSRTIESTWAALPAKKYPLPVRRR